MSCYTALVMDAKDLETLELDKVLERLAAFAAFSASKSMARDLVPAADLEVSQRCLAQTTEAREILAANPELTIGGARDVRSSATAASRGIVLEPSELLDLKSTLIAARRLQRLFERLSDEYPAMAVLAVGLEPAPGVIDLVSKTLNDRGEVVDGASEKLATIRRDFEVVHERLMSKMQRLVGDPKIAPLLQEPIITQREDRYVIPLRAEFKGRLKSVVQDQSSSGATLFVEPLQVVELNNRLRELKLDERDEIHRILSILSERVGREAQSIQRTVEALAGVDLAFAKARYAEALEASEPILKPFEPRGESPHPGSTLWLLGARHPLLDAETVVPIDLALDQQTYALVITGPNTGGKTVALKTAGLLALMAGCGLHIPAEAGSQVSLFEAVYADIGDEQSIEQSLSTFSAHIDNIIRILKHADNRSLVLLDELGAGTDPQEGSALARAILGSLLERRVTTLVATHYPELKAYAHMTPGVRNASVQFDLDSLRPTYDLTIGLPGRSNALAIAERLGLEKGVVERARRTLAPEDLQTDGLLDEIRRQLDAAQEGRRQAEAAAKGAEALRTELRDRLEGIEDERLELLAQARREAEMELEAVRKELRRLRRRLAAAGQPLSALPDIEADVETLEEKVEAPLPRSEPEIVTVERVYRPGDRVRVRPLDAEGVITDLGAEEAEVLIGRLRLRARLAELSHVGGEGSEPDRPTGVKAAGDRGSARLPKAPPLQIDLRGRRIEDALEELDRRLDSAFLAGLPMLRVIHGKGTGRLREAVRQQLKGNPYVEAFEAGAPSEGGQGVTVVKLATG